MWMYLAGSAWLQGWFCPPVWLQMSRVWLSFIFCLAFLHYCPVFLYCVLKRCKPQGSSHAGVALRPPVMKDLASLYRGITGSYCGTRRTRFRCLLWLWVSVQEVCRWCHVWTEDEHTHQSDPSYNNHIVSCLDLKLTCAHHYL